MADLKISQLTDGGASQATDEYVVARSGSNFRIDGASVAAAATSVGTLSSLTVSGDLTVDTSTLKVDSTNNRVGIGTASPAVALDIVGVTNWQASAGTVLGKLTYSGGEPVVLANTGLGLQFFTNNAFAAKLDASGNLGLGVTPSAWSGLKGLQVADSTMLAYAGTSGYVGSNSYYGSAGGSGFKYYGNGLAALYAQEAGVHKWFNAPNNTSGAGAAISFTQAMTLDASGNLGVGGTATVGVRLHVIGGADTARFASTDANNMYMGFYYNTSTLLGYIGNGSGLISGGANGNFGIRAESALLFAAGGATERARITSGGYFKASDTGTYVSSTATFHEFNQSANSNAVILDSTNASMTSTVCLLRAVRNTTNNTFYAYEYYNIGAGASKFLVADSGNVTNTNGTYGTISDIKHKQDIIDAPSQWDDLKAIRFRKFRMKSDVAANPNAPYMLGVVAQELQAVSPGLVEAHPDTEKVEVTDEDGNVTTETRPTGTETLSVKSSILLMKAAVALQEAMARIEALEARLEALEA